MKPFSDIPIGELLPQQPPFRFVDSLENYTPESAIVAFTPEVGKNLLMEGDHLAAAGLIEHMAQASAARVGYISKCIMHVPVSIGFIGQTEVIVRQEVFKITLVDVVVKCGDEIIATANLKSALPE